MEVMKMVNGSWLRVEPSGAWSQCGDHRGASRVPSASLSGRRRWGWITRAFSPGCNMTGLRPDWTGVDSVVREVARSGQTWAGMWAQLGNGGCEIGKWRSFSHLETALTRLFPLKSTQVVDFPRMWVLRLFSEGARIGFSVPKREVMV